MSRPEANMDRCTQTHRESLVKVEANGRKAVFENHRQEEILVTDVDCWLPESGETKADYVISKPLVIDVIVELKGKQIDHAISQIVATVQKWRELRMVQQPVGGLVVFTRSPNDAATLKSRQIRLWNNHKISLVMDKSGKTGYRFESFLRVKP